MDRPPDMSSHRNSDQLLDAIKNEQSSIKLNEQIRTLLQNGAEPRVADKDKASALYLAIEKGCIDVARQLLEHHEKVDVEGKPGRKMPLFAALRNSDEAAVNLLLRYNARVDRIHMYRGETCLQVAIKEFNSSKDPDACLRVCQALLDRGAQLEHRNSEGKTALWIAVYGSYLNVVDLLVARGANINLKNEIGESLLHIASGMALLCIVKKLLDAGADVNAVTNRNTSVLEYATRLSNNEMKEAIVKLLIVRGANFIPKARPLVDCFHWGSTIMKLLLVNGSSDVNKMYKGNLPLAIAFRNHNLRIATTLLCHIALLESQGQPVHQDNLATILSRARLRGMYKQCLDELETMRSTRIVDELVISYFDLVANRHDALVTCLRHEEVRLVIASHTDSCEKKFPMYFDFVQINCRVGLRRLAMLQKAEQLLQCILGKHLPAEITANISQYLNVKELEGLCSAAELLLFHSSLLLRRELQRRTDIV